MAQLRAKVFVLRPIALQDCIVQRKQALGDLGHVLGVALLLEVVVREKCRVRQPKVLFANFEE